MSDLKFVAAEQDGKTSEHGWLKGRVYLEVEAQDEAGADHGMVHGWVTPSVIALIKAAPDLLLALRQTVAALEGKPCRQQALDDARAAIAAATPK